MCIAGYVRLLVSRNTVLQIVNWLSARVDFNIAGYTKLMVSAYSEKTREYDWEYGFAKYN